MVRAGPNRQRSDKPTNAMNADDFRFSLSREREARNVALVTPTNQPADIGAVAAPHIATRPGIADLAVIGISRLDSRQTTGVAVGARGYRSGGIGVTDS